MGSSDAQNASAAASFVSNGLTFVTSSLMGSISDEKGRRGDHVTWHILIPPSTHVSGDAPVGRYGTGASYHDVANASTGIVNWIRLLPYRPCQM